MSSKKNELYPWYLARLILGGLCVGTGIVNLIWSFGWPGGSLQSDFNAIGFSGLDNIEMLPHSEFSLPLIVVGLCLMVWANATAWQETDGY